MTSWVFESIHWLWLLLLLPLLFFINQRFARKATLLYPATLPLKAMGLKPRKPLESSLFRILRLAALALLIIALARPQKVNQDSFSQTNGIDIMLTLDLSPSMLGLDLATSNKLTTRFDVAQGVLKEFIQKRNNDKLGLVAFGGASYLVSPPTLNHDWITQNLQRLKIGITEGGTAIGSAIAQSTYRLKDIKSPSKVIILLTDGANNSGSISPIAAADAAAALNIKIYTIAIGKDGITPRLGLDINGNIAKDLFGKPIIIHEEMSVDFETLEEIARITNGQAYRATNPDELRYIYNQIDQLETTEIKLRSARETHEYYAFPLFLGLLLISTERLLRYTRYRETP